MSPPFTPPALDHTNWEKTGKWRYWLSSFHFYLRLKSLYLLFVKILQLWEKEQNIFCRSQKALAASFSSPPSLRLRTSPGLDEIDALRLFHSGRHSNRRRSNETGSEFDPSDEHPLQKDAPLPLMATDSPSDQRQSSSCCCGASLPTRGCREALKADLRRFWFFGETLETLESF